MGHRLSKIYTRTGDKGETGLGDGSRTAKSSPRVQTFGDIDELNSVIGLSLAHLEGIEAPPLAAKALHEIQHHLFDLGGELCVSDGSYRTISEKHSEWLEKVLDQFNADLPYLKEFILPAGGRATSACHLARTVCRRAERSLVALAAVETVSAATLAYINRLSDLLFVLARVFARAESGKETLWQRERQQFPTE